MDSVRQIRWARRPVLAAVVATGACSIPTWGDNLSVGDVEGTYVLEQVDGRPVEEGESTLSISPRAGDTAPLYGWNVRQPQVEDFDDDVGMWSVDGDAVRFRSQRGLGAYVASAEPVTDAGAGNPRLTVRGRAGHSYTFRRVRGGTITANLTFLEVAVVDPAGRQVPGATLRFRAPDGVVTAAGTTEFGPFLMTGPAGRWTVTVTAPAGYTPAPGQVNPVPIATVAAQTIAVRIELVPVTGG